MRNDRVRQRIQREPTKVGRFLGFDQARFTGPRRALEKEVDSFVYSLVAFCCAVHCRERGECARINRDTQFLFRLTARGIEHALVLLNVAGGRCSPVAVHESGAFPQLEQNVIPGAEENIGSGYDPKTLHGQCSTLVS